LLGRNLDVAAGVTLALIAAPVAFAAVGSDSSTVSSRAPRIPDVHVSAHLADELDASAKPPVSDSLTWPLHGEVTGRFHEARAGHLHEGIDIPAPMGTPIRAAAPGRVVMREEQQGYGRYTCIAHRAITTCYGHQSRFGTKLGAHVRRGEVIGYVGNSGNAPAIHLHFEVRRGVKPWGTPMNPLKRLPRG
jgi:murein DD-endopeptidase MepM/ murein hydrolase activator NlpD